MAMVNIQEIETAVTHLPEDKLIEFREWFEKFDAQQWDRQFEDDASSGKLDALADEALNSMTSKKCTEL